MEDTEIVILAGGKGERMGIDAPKVLAPLAGATLIECLLHTIKGFSRAPILVVGHKAEDVMGRLGEKYKYAFQSEPLGTGHAVMCAKNAVSPYFNNIMVLYGDMPFVSRDTIEKLVELRESEESPFSMATVNVGDYGDWRKVFYRYGRILRDKDRRLRAIREFKEASPKEKEKTEVNPAYFCFDSEWLWENLEKVPNLYPYRGEYYLTDLVEIAVSQRAKISTLEIPAEEALGANTLEELEILERMKAGNL